MTTSDNIAAIEKALEGVTPGRWGQYHPTYAPEAEGAPFSTWDSSHDLSAMKDGKRVKRIATFTHANDAAYVDACSPDRISAILAEARKAEAMKQETDAMREKAIANARERNAAEQLVSELINIRSVWTDPDNDELCRRARTLLNGGSDAQQG